MLFDHTALLTTAIVLVLGMVAVFFIFIASMCAVAARADEMAHRSRG